MVRCGSLAGRGFGWSPGCWGSLGGGGGGEDGTQHPGSPFTGDPDVLVSTSLDLLLGFFLILPLCFMILLLPSFNTCSLVSALGHSPFWVPGRARQTRCL